MNRLSSNRWNLAASLLFLMLTAATTWGQDATGRIVGNVTDQSGAPISDVKVTVTNTGTSNVQNTATNADGFYQVVGLPIGSYTVTFEHPGFRNQVFERQ